MSETYNGPRIRDEVEVRDDAAQRRGRVTSLAAQDHVPGAWVALVDLEVWFPIADLEVVRRAES